MATACILLLRSLFGKTGKANAFTAVIFVYVGISVTADSHSE